MQEIDAIYNSYLFLKDSLRITGRIFDQKLPGIQRKTIFEAMPYNEFSQAHSVALSELDNLVVLSLFAAFERSLRDNFSKKMDVLKKICPEKLGAGIYKLTNDEIERWQIEKIFSLFVFTIGEESVQKRDRRAIKKEVRTEAKRAAKERVINTSVPFSSLV